MSDENFIERSMYRGKGDKNPKKPLFGGIILAILTLGVGIWYYLKVVKWENEGGITMNRLSRLLYDMGGSLAILIFFILMAAVLVWAGYSSYKNKKGE